MNIFRVLAQGDGSINEPNVSAFLGYLLNPGEDHGLDSLFLEKFLQLHHDFCKRFQTEGRKNKENKAKEKDPFEWLNDDFGMSSKYEVKVFFEQAFKDIPKPNLTENQKKLKSSKQVVDIILVIYEVGDVKAKSEKKELESKFKNYISDKRRLKHIFLIEVKIKDNSSKPGEDDKEGQLEKQIENSKELIFPILKEKEKNLNKAEFEKMLSAIFVTPGKDFKISKSAFIHSFNYNSNTTISKSHLFWNFPENGKAIIPKKFNRDEFLNHYDYIKFHETEEEEENNLHDNFDDAKSIENILDDLIYPNKQEKQPPIPLYSLDTIKSFSEFIYSDFSFKMKRPKREIKYHSLGELMRKEENLFSKEMWKIIERIFQDVSAIFENGKEVTYTFHSTHIISFWYKHRKFGDLTKSKQNEILLKIRSRDFYKNKEKDTEEELNIIKLFLKSINLEYNFNNEGKDNSYYQLVFGDKDKPEELASIIIKYFESYKNIVSVKKEAVK